MVIHTPFTICIKHYHGMQPCRQGLTHFGAGAAAVSFSSISMGIWNKRRLVAFNVAVFLADALLFKHRLRAWSTPGSQLITKPWQWWKLLSPSFIHPTSASLLFNMLALYSWDPELEQACGSNRLWDTYVVSAVASNASPLLWPMNVHFGASGVCMGVITALTLHLYRHSSQDSSRSAAQAAAVWALCGLLLGGFWSYLGGGVAGALLADTWDKAPKHRTPRRGRIIQRRGSGGRGRPSAF